jgi:hypothetical protein
LPIKVVTEKISNQSKNINIRSDFDHTNGQNKNRNTDFLELLFIQQGSDTVNNESSCNTLFNSMIPFNLFTARFKIFKPRLETCTRSLAR